MQRAHRIAAAAALVLAAIAVAAAPGRAQVMPGAGYDLTGEWAPRFHEDQPARNLKYGLKAPGDRRVIRYRDLPPAEARYLARRRQCNRQEIAEIDERIRRKSLA